MEALYNLFRGLVRLVTGFTLPSTSALGSLGRGSTRELIGEYFGPSIDVLNGPTRDNARTSLSGGSLAGRTGNPTGDRNSAGGGALKNNVAGKKRPIGDTKGN